MKEEQERYQTEMHIEMTDASIEELILTVLPVSMELVEALMTKKETFDKVLLNWYGIDFETYKSIIEDIIRFTNQRRVEGGKIIYEFAYEGNPICMSPVLDAPLLTMWDQESKDLYEAAEKNQNHERVSKAGNKK